MLEKFIINVGCFVLIMIFSYYSMTEGWGLELVSMKWWLGMTFATAFVLCGQALVNARK